MTGDDQLTVAVEPDDPDWAEAFLWLDDRLRLERRDVDDEDLSGRRSDGDDRRYR